MDALRKDEIYTIDYIDNLPEGERAELIDGYIYNMAPPGRRHQQILFSTARKIADYIDSNNGECEVNIAPFAVYLNNDNKTYVDPEKERITVYNFEKETAEEYTFGEDVPAGIYENFSVNIK